MTIYSDQDLARDARRLKREVKTCTICHGRIATWFRGFQVVIAGPNTHLRITYRCENNHESICTMAI